MMKLQDILTADCTFSHQAIKSKKRILEEICTIAATKISELSHQELLDGLMEREKMGSTGIGNGIAIPHGRLKDSTQVIAVLITTEEPINFDAIDNRPVDIYIGLFVPENCCEEHLSTLQSIAQIFSDKANSKKIRKCSSDDELYQLVSSFA